MFILVHKLIEGKLGAMVQELLIDVVDDELAPDCLLEQNYLVYYFLRDVIVPVLQGVLYTFQDCAEDYVGVGYQLPGDFLPALREQVGEEGDGGIGKLVGSHQLG